MTVLRLGEQLSTDVVTAWAAGFFEGEGTVGIARRWNDDTFRLQIQACGVDVAPLERLHTRWGGSLNTVKSQTRYLTRRLTWVWTLQGRMAAACLCDMRPFMSSSRQIARVQLAVSFQQSRPKKGGRRSLEERDRQHACYVGMRALNVRGVRGIEPPGRARSQQELRPEFVEAIAR